MSLSFGFSFSDLYDAKRLEDLYKTFEEFLEKERVLRNSHFLVIAPYLEKFLGELFGISAEISVNVQKYQYFGVVEKFQREFIQRQALYDYADAVGIDGNQILIKLDEDFGTNLSKRFCEGDFIRLSLDLLSANDALGADLIKQYAAWAYFSSDGRHKHADSLLFSRPERIKKDELFPLKSEGEYVKSTSCKNRIGFDLTDCGASQEEAYHNAFYCIKCHKQKKDTCRTGISEARGCPLNQKISEMNLLYEQGYSIGALAVIVMDNPMVAATGHRICYDCTASCIFQKQTPVDIPNIETRILKDVLKLDYGFEIYSLLTRWNPLKKDNPFPLKKSNKAVLIVGQGPAGIAIAHYMLNYGHEVVAIDGLKVEPFPKELKDSSKPIRKVFDYFEPLSKRRSKGFGGVAEYGITSRWEKNFLFVLRLLLERRSGYRLFDGVRFGSTLTVQDAFELYGFSHIALCLGAGSPKILQLDNIVAPGVRQAADFLMAFHLGELAKDESFGNFRVRMPIGVIGAGLTAVDAATEALAYYPVQVLKFKRRYDQVLHQKGAEAAKKILDLDAEVSKEFLEHAEILQRELDLAKEEGRAPNFLPYLQEWGGATIFYRGKLNQSPSYRLNPFELKKALDEGVQFVEHASLVQIQLGVNKAVESVRFDIQGEVKRFSICTLLTAAGTKPNVVLADELDELNRSGNYFKADGFTVYTHFDGRKISYLGDLHPDYYGSVVKALASAKDAAPSIHKNVQGTNVLPALADIDKTWVACVSDIQVEEKCLTLTVRAPTFARHYKFGNVYKLQRYSSNTSAIPESIPLSAIKVSGDFITFKVRTCGASTINLKNLVINEKIYLMGPAGSALSFKLGDQVSILFEKKDFYVEALMNYLSKLKIDYVENVVVSNATKIICVGSEKFSSQTQIDLGARPLPKGCKVLSVVNTLMQCMMKEVCAQCLYTTTCPKTGKKEIKFACVNNMDESIAVDYQEIFARKNYQRCEEELLL